jgi:hypothetical protein
VHARRRLDPDLIAQAHEVERTGEIGFGSFHTYPTEE